MFFRVTIDGREGLVTEVAAGGGNRSAEATNETLMRGEAVVGPHNSGAFIACECALRKTRACTYEGKTHLCAAVREVVLLGGLYTLSQ